MKFLAIQESAYKQKARIQWLQLGDSNTKFFFTAMKERYSRNSIDILFDSTGKKLTTGEIADEISKFYKALMGTTAPTLRGVVVRRSPQLSNAQNLIQPVTIQEIDVALNGIDTKKLLS